MSTQGIDVDARRLAWAANIIESVRSGGDLRVEVGDALQTAGGVFSALLEGKYSDRLVKRCDVFLTEFSLGLYGWFSGLSCGSNAHQSPLAHVLCHRHPCPMPQASLWDRTQARGIGEPYKEPIWSDCTG